jgi:hypothetical protein
VPTVADVQPAAAIITGLAAHQVLIAVGGRYQEATVGSTHLSDLSEDQLVVALGHSIGSGAAELSDRLGPPHT